MSEIEDLRRGVIELRDWKEAVLGKCKASSGWDDLKWGGDKEGWGFVHYFIGHLNTRALEAEAALATPTAAQATGQWQPIEDVPPRGNAAMLLYFPPKVVGAYKQSTLPVMYRTGHPDDFPTRAASHFMLLEAPSVPSASRGTPCE